MPADLANLFSGDLAIATGDLSRVLDRLEREGYRFEAQPDPEGRLILMCVASPLDARLRAMKEFRHDPRPED